MSAADIILAVMLAIMIYLHGFSLKRQRNLHERMNLMQEQLWVQGKIQKLFDSKLGSIVKFAGASELGKVLAKLEEKP